MILLVTESIMILLKMERRGELRRKRKMIRLFRNFYIYIVHIHYNFKAYFCIILGAVLMCNKILKVGNL